MKITLINPNTTASMTRKALASAQAAAAPDTTVVGVQPAMGPESIEGFYDEAFSIPGLIQEITAAPDSDGYVLACFDDTGLDAARCITRAPVVGIGEAAFHMASMVANQFGVVTTLSRSLPALNHNLVKYGLAARCSGVRASDIPVLDLEKNDPEALATIAAVIARCRDEDGAEAIVLGCAGMTDLASDLQAQQGLPVIDGVGCAVKLVEGMVSLGIKTSTAGGYAPPRHKRYSGALSGFAPSV